MKFYAVDRCESHKSDDASKITASLVLLLPSSTNRNKLLAGMVLGTLTKFSIGTDVLFTSGSNIDGLIIFIFYYEFFVFGWEHQNTKAGISHGEVWSSSSFL